MLNWIQTLLTVIEYIWPMRRVEQWERGAYYIWGRYVGSVGPGIWPIVPFFMDVKSSSVVWGVVSTPLLTVTARDMKTTITYSAAATLRIAEIGLAYNAVDNVGETMRELLSALTADKLATVPVEKLDGEKRKDLLKSLTALLNRELAFCGLEVQAVRFTNFVINMRSFRLMTDTALLP